MEENLEVSAKTVEEAIQLALEQLGVSREEVKINVVKEGKSGLLGLGAEEATVRVSLLKAEDKGILDTARSVVETILAHLEMEASVVPQPSPLAEGGDEAMAPIVFDIKGDDLGILIGRQGQTLACLQYIVRLIVANQTKSWLPITIDVEEYRQRRDKSLQALAERIAEQVKIRKTPFTLRPMPAYERRIIHLTLADYPDVTTESIGSGEARRVVISSREH